jgi:heparan-alpha-glucosaminide N-acetyltransferase
MSIGTEQRTPAAAHPPTRLAGLPPAPRVASIDVFRGFVMFLMLAEVLRLPQVAEAFPNSAFWQFLSFHQSHVAWTGCSLHDLIQPSFSFLVGAALPFSIASRRARGQSVGWMTLHAAWRALLLIFLGVFLRSVTSRQTNFTFEDTLSQIGLGYLFLFFLGLRSQTVQWAAFVLIVVGYWGAFALYPEPPADFDYATVSVPANWPHHYTGFLSHWNKNSNLAWAFDTWFLNLFPRPSPFIANGGGYATLSFIPTLGTMILGLIAGGWLRNSWTRWRLVAMFVAAGLVLLGLGIAAQEFGICPSVKRIWTPAWTLYSGGWCFLILAATYLICDVLGFQAWALPLIVIGANSIFIYFIHGLFEGFIQQSFRVHFGPNVFKLFGLVGNQYEPLLAGGAVLIVFWLMLYWMYRRKIFLRI